MESNANLYQKVLSLIIGDLALEISDLGRVDLCSDRQLEEDFNHFLASIKNKATAYKPENAAEVECAEKQSDESLMTTPESVRQDQETRQNDSISSTPVPDEVLSKKDEQIGVIADFNENYPCAITTKSDKQPDSKENGDSDKNWQPAPFLSLETKRDTSSAAPEKKDLKPGQIPSKPASILIKTTAPLRPIAKINISNARAGTPFNSKIDISLSNGEIANVLDVNFSSEIGITYDLTNAELKGTPSKSGDIEMTVTWSLVNGQIYSERMIFIVNPDPRSLWKIIEPPADDKYFKENIDHRQLHESDIMIAGASRRGRSHEHVGSFRDDDFSISHCPDTGWSIMLVADGAGSAKNSRQGSRIVAETVGRYLTNYFGGDHGRELSELVKRWETADQQNIGNAFRHLFEQASVMAINNIKNESIANQETVKSYSTTLLVAVTYRSGEELFAASFWMGDGAIAAYGPQGKVRVLGTPDSGEYAGQTRFLDADAVADPDFSKRVSIGRWRDISHLILMTDGVSDPFFETDNGLLRAEKWDALVSELSPVLNNTDKTSEELAEWLNFFIPGNHDDRTIVVYW